MKRSWVILASGLVASASIIGARWAISFEADGSRRPTGVETIPTASPEPSGPAPLKPGQPVPDATLVTQSGNTISLAGFKGQILVLSFMYTHCNVMSMCPMATRKLMELQALARKRHLNVHFLVVSFDPGDSPEVLREYAKRYEVDLSNWDFATGSPEVVGPLARSLNTYYRRTAGETFEHNIIVSIVDSNGILHDDFFGTEWNTEEFLRAIERKGP